MMVDSAKYRHALPQRSGALFLTDGGIETTLIFQDGFDLPRFAEFHLLRDAKGREGLMRYYERHIAIAKADRLGITRAAAKAGLPVVISFTVETDGRLPTGQSLADAICEVDIVTGKAPAYYMINCAHPTHFDKTLSNEPWTRRVGGLRANASKRSHRELNDSTDLDAGNPVELGAEYRELARRHPQINVLGGCCGTNHRHIECIALACREVNRAA
jgi:S-methylmethionine-dependent homocysteine/selenocysteine methylase